MALRQSRHLLGLLTRQGPAAEVQALAVGSSCTQQFRGIGGDRIPDCYARPSPYTEGTQFLGTPADHLKLIEKRPLSPDVMELDMKHTHYKMPWGALSSIANRGTGVALSAGFTLSGYIALAGDLPGTLAAFASGYPLLAVPVKFAVAFPLIYHFSGGVRHMVWDTYKIGNQNDTSSLLETSKVELSSQVLLGASTALALVAALL